AILYGTFSVWALMVAGAQYNLATDPEYNSFAAGISILVGWLPGSMYSALCVSIVAIVSAILRRDTDERHER
ncbi:hypothetical protein, partial [Crateriforma spongiae]